MYAGKTECFRKEYFTRGTLMLMSKMGNEKWHRSQTFKDVLVLRNDSRETFGCPTLILNLGVVPHIDDEEQIGVCVEVVLDYFSLKYNFFHGMLG